MNAAESSWRAVGRLEMSCGAKASNAAIQKREQVDFFDTVG